MKTVQERGWLFWVFVCIALLIGGRILMRQKPGLTDTINSYVLYPFLVIQNNIIKPYSTWRSKHRAGEALEKCIEKVVSERDQLLATVIALKAELDYLEAIKELLIFKERYQVQDAITAQIIAKHFSTDGHYFLVDAGSKQGITRDMIAVYNNCLLGRVVEVYPLYSKVAAITDKGCNIAVYCAQTKTAGIHEGENSLHSSALKFVSHLKEIKEGDYLLSSGEGLIFPRGFGVGRICSFETDNLFYRIKVKPLVDLNEVGHCCLWHRGIYDAAGTAIADNWQKIAKEEQETVPANFCELPVAPQPPTSMALQN